MAKDVQDEAVPGSATHFPCDCGNPNSFCCSSLFSYGGSHPLRGMLTSLQSINHYHLTSKICGGSAGTIIRKQLPKSSQPFRYPEELFNFSCLRNVYKIRKEKKKREAEGSVLARLTGVTLTVGGCTFCPGFEVLIQPQLLPDLLKKNIYGPKNACQCLVTIPAMLLFDFGGSCFLWCFGGTSLFIAWCSCHRELKMLLEVEMDTTKITVFVYAHLSAISYF